MESMLEQLDQDAELVVEITKEDGEAITTYDIGYDHSDTGEFMLRVRA
jgi:hypothetical protein